LTSAPGYDDDENARERDPSHEQTITGPPQRFSYAPLAGRGTQAAGGYALASQLIEEQNLGSTEWSRTGRGSVAGGLANPTSNER